MRILIVSQSFAEWGGLQEWVTGLSVNLRNFGHEVGLVTASAEVSDRVSIVGVHVYELDWLTVSTESVLELVGCEWQVIITTPLKSRAVGISLAEALDVPCIATFHGVYADYVYSWKHRVSKIVPMAPALANMLRSIGGVDNSAMETIPNGIPVRELRTEPLSYDARMQSGVFNIAMACRLEADKFGTLGVLKSLLPKLQLLGFDAFNLILMGDGSERAFFESQLRSLQNAGSRKFRYELAGWVEPEAMFQVMSGSMVTVGGGRAALHSLAGGTPVIGAGARAFVGVSSVRRLQALLDCNFGDYIPGRDLSTYDDLEIFQDRIAYEEAGGVYRDLLERNYTEESVASKFAALCSDLVTSNETSVAR